MTGQPVPPELRELLGLLTELAGLLPSARDMAGWEQRDRVAQDRDSLLGVRLQILTDALRSAEKYPNLAAQIIGDCCEGSIARIREELDKPLGYLPLPPIASSANKVPGLSHG